MKSNHFKKINTPTVGGIFIIIPFLIFLLTICIKYYSIKILLLFCCIFGFFIIGFLDDYLSIKNKKNTGLKSLEKLFLQSLISSVFILLAFKADYITPSILISESLKINTSLMILPISFFTLVGLSNSVNLTDGLDGLATGLSAISLLTFGAIAYASGRTDFSDYLNILYIKGADELLVFCFASIGACLGFLWYNSYPATIFMGDTGSLSLGGIIAVVAILIRKELLLPILCGIFLIENLSVVLQVGWFKYTKKKFGEGRRIFRMSPLHHHYQKLGYHESKIVTRFWIVGIMLAVISIVTLKLR